MPKVSSRTFATVARQFVVQDALDTSSCLTGSYFCSLTPSTTVMSGSLAGAVMTTFLAPARRCLDEGARSRKIPVDSTTIPTPISPQGRVAGSLAEQTRISRPLTKVPSPLAFPPAASRPGTGSGRARGSALDDPGHREDADGAGRGVLEAAGALGQGGAGRQDVVHHDDVATRDQLGAPQPERAPHVRASGGAVERGLRWRRHRAYEDIVAHRAAPRPGESPGEQSRLIEAPLALPSRVQRDRHEQLGRPDGQVPLERLDQQVAEGAGEGAVTTELERVQGLAGHVLVAHRRARVREGRRLSPAGRAERASVRAHRPGWHRAGRDREARHRLPPRA